MCICHTQVQQTKKADLFSLQNLKKEEGESRCVLQQIVNITNINTAMTVDAKKMFKKKKKKNFLRHDAFSYVGRTTN